MAPMIDLTRLSDEELIDLNRRVVERLRLIRSARQLVDLARFSVGMRVEFPTDDGRTLQGDIARLNRKTATVCGNPSGHWRVSPALLRPIADQQTTVALGARPVRGIAPESVDKSSLVTVVPASSR
jgi:hypothetical protein